MSNSVRQAPDPRDADGATRGPNLALIYSLIGIALVAALAIAAAIVLPFYLRR